MKLIVHFATLFLLISCNGEEPINYSKINGIEDINEQVIKDFYTNVLDTLIGDCFYQNIPFLQTELIDKTNGYSDLSEQDQDFFKEQIDKFESLRWETLTTNKKILSDSDKDTFTNHGARKGWEIFRKKYGKGCICYITIPLFTKDCKRIYLEYGQQCAALNGHGEIIVFEFVDNKWILEGRYQIWVS